MVVEEYQMILKNFIKKTFFPLFNHPIYDHLRARLGVKPPRFVRPLSKRASISDLFPWRVDDVWDTQFEILNLPSILLPDNAQVDVATIVLFNSEGSEVARHVIKLNPFDSKRVRIGDLLGDLSGTGTFACFHSSSDLGEIQRAGCYLADRQYVSFLWKGDLVCNYAHGNIYGLSKLPNEDKIQSVVYLQPKIRVYRPQLRFDDCDRFELAYSNPCKESSELLVRIFDENWQELERRENKIPPRGLKILEFNNHSRQYVFVENQSWIGLWRPIIFKYYKSYFDVLHS